MGEIQMTKWKNVRCPYHNDKHPSAGVITRKDGSQWLHCMACSASRPYTNNLDSKETVIMADEEEYENYEAENDLKPSLNPMKLLEDFIEDKGITYKTIEQLSGYISNEGYLVLEYGNGKRIGRYLGKEKKPRFINEEGNKGLLGEETIADKDELFLVEGITDYLSMIQDVALNVVCSFGAELSEEQAYLLRGKTIFILYDKDFAGYKGAKQATERLKEYGATPIVLELYDDPKCKDRKVDVNYLIKTNRNEFVSWLAQVISKYKAFDSDYIPSFQNRKPLKYYKSDISLLKFTEGLYVITGQPGVGKTTLGITLMDHFTMQGAKVLYCNYDLPKDQIVSRIASRYSKYSWAEIESDPSLLEDKIVAQLKLSLSNIKVMNGLTIDEIKYCKKYYDCIVIDYLQRIPSGESDTRLAIEKNLAPLSEMASENGKTVICISRMPVSAYGKTDGHLFSGSAAIEYNAQAAIVLHKDASDIICCNVIKNTRGEIGTTFFSVDYPHQKIKETSLRNISREMFDDKKGYSLYE